MSDEGDDWWGKNESDTELEKNPKTVKIELSTSERERELRNELDKSNYVLSVMAHKYFNDDPFSNPVIRPSVDRKGSGGSGSAVLRPEDMEYSRGVSKPESDNPKHYENYYEYRMKKQIGEMQNRGASKGDIASETMKSLYEAKFHAKPNSPEDRGIDRLISRIADIVMRSEGGKNFKITALKGDV